MKETMNQFREILESKGLVIEQGSMAIDVEIPYVHPDGLVRTPFAFRCVLLSLEKDRRD